MRKGELHVSKKISRISNRHDMRFVFVSTWIGRYAREAAHTGLSRTNSALILGQREDRGPSTS
jgi:hypothetical protein